MGMEGAEWPVALTTARCSRVARVVKAVLFTMMSGPPMASSSGRFSFASLGFWLTCRLQYTYMECKRLYGR